MGKNVAVFVDVANIFYAAKAAGVDIDYVTMLKSATAGRDLVRAYAYTGLDPDNENQRNFHDFLRRSNYKVVSKDIRKYGDGKVKANLDIELVVDMMKTARNLDIAIVVSGDGDFAPAIRAVQEMGVRVEVISFRGNTSSDLIEVADLFTDIIQIARVEKGTGRSGRRVATDDEDLSMTEVPDKQTEGTGAGRGRGRGTGRSRTGEGERVAASGRPAASRGRSRVEPVEVAATASVAAASIPSAGRAGLVALPGEKLSRAAVGGPIVPAVVPVGGDAIEDVDEEEQDDAVPLDQPGVDGEEPRRRRRRGGRGRGRGRGRDGEGIGDTSGPVVADGAAVDDAGSDAPDNAPVVPRVTRPAAAAFGSVWDSQLPATRTPAPRRDLPIEEEFDDEPAIPEYLIAERRGNGRSSAVRPAGGGRGGARAGYNAAVDRERFGRGGGGGGINRYPDVSGRTAPVRDAAPRNDRPRDGGRDGGRNFGRGAERPERTDRIPGAPRPGEGWSEVPPELEAMLRAQLAAGGGGSAPRRDRGPARPSGSSQGQGDVTPAVVSGGTDAPTNTATDAEAAPRRRTARAAGEAPAKAGAARAGRGRSTSTTAGADAEASTPAVEAPKARATRTRAAAPKADVADAAVSADDAAPKRRTTRAKATPAGDAGSDAGSAAEATAPKRRAPRAKASTGEA